MLGNSSGKIISLGPRMLLTLPLPDEVLKDQLECDFFFGEMPISRVNHSLLSGSIEFSSYKKHSSNCVTITHLGSCLILCVCVFSQHLQTVLEHNSPLINIYWMNQSS